MADVGIRLTMTENVSSLAPKVSESLKNISKAGEELKEALEMEGVEQKYRQFAERIDRLHDVQRAQQEQALVEERVGRGRVQLRERIGREVEGVSRRAPGAFQQIATGDVFGTAISGLGMLGGLLPFGAALSVGVGGLLIGNMLSKEYEKIVPALLDTTAALGAFGKTSKDTADSLMKTFKDVQGTVKEFGYTLEQGLEVTRSMAAMSGMTRGAVVGQLGNLMAYARGFGVAPEALARYQALGLRFGMEGNVFGAAAGALRQGQMGPGLYQEFLDATLGIFEQGISNGIVQGFSDINVAQSWIAQLGDAFKGQYGVNLYNKMQGAMIGATNLSTETDVIMFRAARRMLEGMSQAEKERLGLGGPENYVNVFQAMERGAAITPRLFSHVRDIIGEMTGYNRTNMVELMAQMYKVNYTVAERLLDMKEAEAVREIEAAKADSPELRVLRVQEDMRETLREMGRDLFEFKAANIEKLQYILDRLGGFVHGVADVLDIVQSGVPGAGIATVLGGAERGGRYVAGMEESALRRIGRTAGLLDREKREAARQITRIYENLSEEDYQRLREAGGFHRIYQAAREHYPREERLLFGEKAVSFHDVVVILQEMLAETKKLNINMEVVEVETEK